MGAVIGMTISVIVGNYFRAFFGYFGVGLEISSIFVAFFTIDRWA